jgi:hypothetical protein
MKDGFNLSERIINQEPDKWKEGYPIYHQAILVGDVKEFIRLLKEKLKYSPYVTCLLDPKDREGVWDEIDKLAGSKLTGDKKE